MKKLTMTVVMFVIVMSAAMASGNGVKSVRANVVAASKQVFKIVYRSEESDIVKIRIKNGDGSFIRTDRVKSKGGFVKPYNMSTLDNGIYIIEITDKFGTFSEQIEIKNEKSAALKSLDNNRFQLTVSTENQTSIEVVIYDDKGTLVHEENHKSSRGFNRVYDLSKFDCDKFTFELNGENINQKLAIR